MMNLIILVQLFSQNSPQKFATYFDFNNLSFTTKLRWNRTVTWLLQYALHNRGRNTCNKKSKNHEKDFHWSCDFFCSKRRDQTLGQQAVPGLCLFPVSSVRQCSTCDGRYYEAVSGPSLWLPGADLKRPIVKWRRIRMFLYTGSLGIVHF